MAIITKVNGLTFLEQWIEVNLDKIVITILQGSVVTQTVLGGLPMHRPVANFLQCICAKNYENWLTVDKVIAMKTVCSFLAHSVGMYSSCKLARVNLLQSAIL